MGDAKLQDGHGRLFFLGAGASVPDGFPVTAALICAVAAFLEDYRSRHGRPSRLEQYLGSVYGLGANEFGPAAAQWNSYLGDAGLFDRERPASELPGIIELLSVIDMAIADGSSFGPSTDNRAKRREFRGNELVRVRERAVEGLARGFTLLREVRRSQGSPRVTETFVRALAPGDILVTTNWDTLIAEAVRQAPDPPGVDYGAEVIRVDDSHSPTPVPERRRTVLHLHGSFSWLHCPCCQNLYVNEQLYVTPEISIERWPPNLECQCGAELTGALVTPTFFKTYRLPQLAEIWRRAQKSLEAAREWVFIGYSVPDDDLWVRGLLLRAIATRRRRADMPAITVVCRKDDGALQERFTRLFKGSPISFEEGGFRSYAEQLARA
jgi:SIR2-like domain